MKKSMIVLLSLALVLTLTACGSSKDKKIVYTSDQTVKGDGTPLACSWEARVTGSSVTDDVLKVDIEITVYGDKERTLNNYIRSITATQDGEELAEKTDINNPTKIPLSYKMAWEGDQTTITPQFELKNTVSPVELTINDQTITLEPTEE